MPRRPHFVFSNPAVQKLRTKIIDRITKYHQEGGKDFGALGMLKWLHVNLTTEDIHLLAFVEEEAGEEEASKWLGDALARNADSYPKAAQS